MIITQLSAMQTSQQQIHYKEISDEEKKMIMLSDDFQRFFNKTSRYIERALAEDVDILMDYTGIMERDGEA
ncbi:unnamed protein product, partial [Notodromas monacha]